MYNKETLQLEPAYELSFIMESLNDFETFDTEDVYIELNMWYGYEFGGIQFMEQLALKKILRSTGDENLYNPYKLLVSSMFSGSTPINIKKLVEKNSIVKSANHGDGNAFINAGFYNKRDYCMDIYSSMFVCKENEIGTGYPKVYIDLNQYDKLKEIDEEAIALTNPDVGDDVIVSAL